MRRTAGTVAIVATLALLAACSGAEETPETTTEPEVEETSEAPEASGSLTIWTDENREGAIAAAAETFTAETGVEIELVQKNFEDIRADFLAQVGAGEGPDITVGAHDWLGALIEDGVVDSIDLAEKADSFEDVAVEAFTYDGQLYGLPYALESIALVRNTALVTEPAADTFDAMIEQGRAAGTKLPFVINTNGTTGDGYHYYAFQTSFGAPVFVQTEDGSYTDEVGMGGEQGLAFAQWLGENGMTGSGIFSTDWNDDIARQEFADGNSPFIVTGPWAITGFQDAGVDFAVEPIPSAGGETAAPFVGVQGFYISAQSDNALVAQDFLVNYLATPEAMMAIHEADPRIPAFIETAEEVASDPVIGGFRASAQNGAPMPNIPEMGSVWEHWNAAQAAIISGSGQPEEAWNKMITDLEAAIGG